MSVFVSYSHGDVAFADQLSQALISANVKVWRDSYRLRDGDHLDERIFAAIRTAKLFIVLLSESSATSTWVEAETAIAVELEAQGLIEIIPVHLDGCTIPVLLGSRLLVDGQQGPVAVAAGLAARALDAASPSSAGERVSDDARSFTHHAREIGFDDLGRMFVQLDIISFDLDEPYSILTQFTFVSAEPVDQGSTEEARSIGEHLLAACAASFAAEPYRVRLHRGDAVRMAFNVHDGPTRFDVACRVLRVGKVDRGAVLFNLGALFGLIAPD